MTHFRSHGIVGYAKFLERNNYSSESLHLLLHVCIVIENVMERLYARKRIRGRGSLFNQGYQLKGNVASVFSV